MQPQPPSPHREHLHQRVEQLLPWYANGTLAEAERRTVEEHLAGCPACRAELAGCRDLARAIDELGEVAPSPHPIQLSRLLARIDALEASPYGDGLPHPPAPEADGAEEPAAPESDARRGAAHPIGLPAIGRPALGGPPLGNRPSGRIAALLGSTPPPVRALLAAQLAGLALLGAVVAGRGAVPAPARHAAAPPLYHTLSEAPPPSVGGAQIRIVFADGATAAAIRDILVGVGGQIVGGPSPLGTYTVEVGNGPGADPLEVVLPHLRARREVTFAAPVAGSDGPGH
jgi:anti-sigma factor RsiW